MSVFYIDSLFHPAPSQTLTAGSFLIESGSHQEVEHTIEVTKAAFETLGEENQDQELYSYLSALSGLAYEDRGLFTAARPWLEQTHQMRAEARHLDKSASTYQA